MISLDLLDPDLASVFGLECAASYESTIVNGEYQRLEQGLVLAVERTVDEDLIVVGPLRRHTPSTPLRSLLSLPPFPAHRLRRGACRLR